MEKLYIATKNPNKVLEFQALIPESFGTVCAMPGDVPDSPETGTSFEANAFQKAMFYGAYCDGWMLADDSGLCVHALSGAPGIYSARYAGEHATSEQNNEKLLQKLDGVPEKHRTAEFVSALAVWHAKRQIGLVVRGTLRGSVLERPKGDRGFGYDPLFYVPEHQQTLAEMSHGMKNEVSHRALAFQSLIPLFAKIL